MAAACFTAFQHIDWLGDTSESWCVTLNKSTPLREECAGVWDGAETKSREQRRKQSILCPGDKGQQEALGSR